MNLNNWLDAEKGRAASLAARLGKTPSAVSQWKTNGVPVDLMKIVRDFTGGEVTLEEMVPGPDLPAPEAEHPTAQEA